MKKSEREFIAAISPDLARAAAEEADREIIRSQYEVQHPGDNHLRIRRIDGKPVCLPWDDLQTYLHEVVGPEACLVEVFPPLDDVVNEENLRHFWIVPPDVLMRCGAWLRKGGR